MVHEALVSQNSRLSVVAARRSVQDSGNQQSALISSVTYAKLIFSSVIVSGSIELYILQTEPLAAGIPDGAPLYPAFVDEFTL